MAQNDNTLGAPTEGLGQNVTFKFQPPGGGAQLGFMGEGVYRTGVSGGNAVGNTQGQGVSDYRPDPTMALLSRVGEELLAPVLKKARTEKFVAGMQQAMHGAAIQDIAAQQPWYSRIFGDSDTVEGARAYLGHTKAQNAVSSMEEAMPTLRQMDPAAAQKFFSDSVQQHLTGDPAADLSIMQGLTTALPSVMRRQAKEHFSWQQEQAAQAEGASFRAGAQRLQGAAEGLQKGYVTPEEFNTLGDSFVRSLVPTQGRDVKNWKDQMADNIRNLAHQGNFHALNAIMQPRDDGQGGKVSLLDALTPDQVDQINKARESGEQRLRTKYSFDWNDQLTDIEIKAAKPPAGSTVDDRLAQIDQLNGDYRKETGSNLSLISPSERAALAKANALAIAHARDKEWSRLEASREKADTAAAKQQAEEGKTQEIIRQAVGGNLNLMSITPGYSSDLINSTVWAHLKGLSPDAQTTILVNNYNRGTYTITPEAQARDGHVLTAVTSADGKSFNGGADFAYKEWLGLFQKGGPDVTAAYYPKTGARMEKFHRAVTEAGVPVETAFAASFQHDMGRTKVDAKVLKASIDEVTSQINDWTPALLGGKKLRPESARAVAEFIGDAAETWTSVLGDPKAGAKRAYAVKKAEGRIETYGEHAWVNPPNVVPLSAYLTRTGGQGQVALGADTLDDVVDAAVTQKLRSHSERQSDGSYKDVPGILPGGSPDYITITRLPDSAGVPQLAVHALKDGKDYSALIPADSMFSLYERHKQEKANQTFGIRNESLQFGPKFSGPTPDPKRPSVYSGAF